MTTSHRKNTQSKFKAKTLYLSCLIGLSTLVVHAAPSPFAPVPIYLTKIEDSRAKHNLMLLIDDSGSMDAVDVFDSETGTFRKRMTVAKEVAIKVIKNEENLKKFRFGLAHLFLDQNSTDYTAWPPKPGGWKNCNTNSACASRIVLRGIDDADSVSDQHINDMVGDINKMTPSYGTPIYSALSAVYKKMPDYMQYRCQKNYVIAITDGAPYESGKTPPASGDGRYDYAANYMKPLTKTFDMATTDLKIGGTDKEGGSWDDSSWRVQNVKTSVIAFKAKISAMEKLTEEGQGFYMEAKDAKELASAINSLVNRLSAEPDPVPVSPSFSQVPSGTASTDKPGTLSARLFTDSGNWSSQLRFTEITPAGNEIVNAGGDLVYKNASYANENDRTTIINVPGRGVQSLNKDNLSTLSNSDFALPVSASSGQWKMFVQWLASWGTVTDKTTGYRDRSSDGSATDIDRYLGDILTGAVVSDGSYTKDYKLSNNKIVKLSEFLMLNSNDGSLKMYQYKDNNTPYELKLSYIPGATKRENNGRIIEELKGRAEKDYGRDNAHPHLYFTGGGQMTQKASPRGQNIVVSTLGQGGRGVFALNIKGQRDGDTAVKTGFSATTSRDDRINHVPLWDSGAPVNNGQSANSDLHTKIADTLGYTIGSAAVDLLALNRTTDGASPIMSSTSAVEADIRMVALVANGYEGTLTVPTLHVVDAIGSKMHKTGAAYINTSGTLLKSVRVTVPTGWSFSKGKALSSPISVDLNKDGVADIAYAADQNGNVYRFDFRSADSTGWVGRPIYQGDPKKPITTAPAVYRKSLTSDEVVVLFGTGSELYEDDAKDTNTQTVYGIYDKIGAPGEIPVIITGGELLKQTISLLPDGSRTATSEKMQSAHKGWYTDLPVSGERVIRDMQVLDGTLYFNTAIITPVNPTPPPGVVCYVSEAKGSGWLMQLKAADGSLADESVSSAYATKDASGNRLIAAGLSVTGVILGSPNFVMPMINEKGEGHLYSRDEYGMSYRFGELTLSDQDIHPGCIPDKTGLATPDLNDPTKTQAEMDVICGKKQPKSPIVNRLSWRVIN